MGPFLANSFVIDLGVAHGTSLLSSRKLAVPYALLSRTLRQGRLHQHGAVRRPVDSAAQLEHAIGWAALFECLPTNACQKAFSIRCFNDVYTPLTNVQW